jgi:phosphotransferase system  glucose/maltose/N-acetylglucosamine-specific IIC component
MFTSKENIKLFGVYTIFCFQFYVFSTYWLYTKFNFNKSPKFENKIKPKKLKLKKKKKKKKKEEEEE